MESTGYLLLSMDHALRKGCSGEINSSANTKRHSERLFPTFFEDGSIEGNAQILPGMCNTRHHQIPNSLAD